MSATFAYMAISAISAVVAAGALTRTHLMNRRAAELTRSNDLMARHMASLERFCADDEVPDDLKAAMLRLSAAFDDKRFVLFFLDDLANPAATEKEPGRFSRYTRHLSSDMSDDLAVSFKAGLTGAILRWKETAPYYRRVVDWLAQGPEASEVRRAIWDYERYRGQQARESEPAAATA